MSKQPPEKADIIRPTKDREWIYHNAEVDMCARRLYRFSTGDLQAMRDYLHANGNPTIKGLAIYAKRCWDAVGGQPVYTATDLREDPVDPGFTDRELAAFNAGKCIAFVEAFGCTNENRILDMFNRSYPKSAELLGDTIIDLNTEAEKNR